MFMLKKILPLLLYPVSLCLGILILGLFCLWATRRQRLGKGLVTLGTVLLLLLSLPCISMQFLTPLERRYPALLHPETISWGEKSSTSPRWIVVLGGGHRSDPSLPANSQSVQPPWGRVVEGVRLYKTIPGKQAAVIRRKSLRSRAQGRIDGPDCRIPGGKISGYQPGVRLPGHRG